MKYKDRLPTIIDECIFNQYEQFINDCIEQNGAIRKKCVHHIVPKTFLNTKAEKQDKENLVALTYEQHVEAHRLLSLCLDSEKIKIAYRLMTTKDVECLKYLSEKAVERLKQLRAENGGVYHTKKYYDKVQKREKRKEEIRLQKIEQEKPKQKTWLETVWKG